MQQVLQNFYKKLQDLQIHKNNVSFVKKFCKGRNISGKVPKACFTF
jgi:hypothetical protein